MKNPEAFNFLSLANRLPHFHPALPQALYTEQLGSPLTPFVCELAILKHLARQEQEKKFQGL